MVHPPEPSHRHTRITRIVWARHSLVKAISPLAKTPPLRHTLPALHGEQPVMPSLFHLMVGLGGTALAVGATVLWLREPQQAPTLPDTFTSSSKMVGRSALSHGGPSSSPTAAGSFSPAFEIGQRVIVAPEEYDSRTVNLLPSPPDSATSPPASGATRALPGGTVVSVSATQITERVPGRMERYYEVTLADGRKGWLSERVLRLSPSED